MTWWLWLILSLVGYEVVSLPIARVVYHEVMWNSSYSYSWQKERHAGKSWGAAQTWGLWAVFGPPVLLVYGVGWCMVTAIGISSAAVCDGVHWFITSDSLSLKGMIPERANLEALTAKAEAEYEEAGKALAELQKPVTPPADLFDDWERKLLNDGGVLWTSRNITPVKGTGEDL